jgi:arylformamidase
MRRIDVSMPLFEGMPAFPGDPEFRSEPVQRIDRGDPYGLSRLVLGSHAGTHVDPPGHFLPSGPSADRLDLEALNGPCQVVAVPAGCALVGPGELKEIPSGTTRILLRTSNSERWARRLEYFADYVALSPEGAASLIARGARLIGIDALSIESDPTHRFPIHRELLARGVLILEGLLLSEALPGAYELECLPLRLRDGDGGPARAVLNAP